MREGEPERKEVSFNGLVEEGMATGVGREEMGVEVILQGVRREEVG